MRLHDTFRSHDRDSDILLWVVVTRPAANGEVAIVGLGPAGARSGEDDIVGPADHPDLGEDCTARYRLARLASQSDLRMGRQAGLLSPGTPCSPELTRRIQRGALASDFIRPAVRAAILRLLEPPPRS